MERRHKRFFKGQFFLSAAILGALVYFLAVDGLVPEEEALITENLETTPLVNKAALNIRAVEHEAAMPAKEEDHALGATEIQTHLSRLAEERAGTWHLHNVDWVANLTRQDQFALFAYLAQIPVNEWRARLDHLKTQSASSLRSALGIKPAEEDEERAFRRKVS